MLEVRREAPQQLYPQEHSEAASAIYQEALTTPGEWICTNLVSFDDAGRNRIRVILRSKAWYHGQPVQTRIQRGNLYVRIEPANSNGAQATPSAP